MRLSVSDHLFSFARYSRHRTLYVNAAYPLPEAWLRVLPIHAIIFHTTFLSVRWHLPAFDYLRRKVAFLRSICATKVAIPQDEFLNTDALCDFISEMGVSHVCTNVNPPDRPRVYRKLPPDSKVAFHRVLTGYVEEKTARHVRQRLPEGRPVDISYRAWKAAYWLGRQGYHKTRIAEETLKLAPILGLKTDISLDSKEQIAGQRWFDFLSRSTAVIGCEAGASVCDHDGSLRCAVEQYMATHPAATYEEVSRRFLNGRDGEVAMHCISPRHFEAALTRTYQILVEGEYDGVLQPNVHYYPVRRDYSNLKEALESLRDREMCATMTERAFQDLIQSGRYSYSTFVAGVEALLPEAVTALHWRQHCVFYLARLYHKLLWGFMIGEATVMQCLKQSAIGSRCVSYFRALFRRRYGE